MKKYFTCSELAKLCGISKQTLIFYDREDIFKPKKIGENNGYRYYSADQLETLDSILILKEIGLPLSQIREIMKKRSISDIVNILNIQRENIEKRIQRDILTSQRIKRKLNAIGRISASEHNTQPHIVTQESDEYLGVENVQQPGDLWQVDVAFKKLFKNAKENDWSHFYQLGVMVSTDKLRGGIYTQAQYAIMPVQNKFDGEKCIVKPKGEYVRCLHIGDYDSIGVTYKKMLSFIDENALKCSDYSYEYCVMDNLTSQDDSEYMTEIYIGVEPKQ